MIRLIALLLCLPVAATAQSSKAAAYLLDQNIAEACNGGPGTAGPGTLVEADFDGDGRQDLLIAHEGIACRTADSPLGRSGLCGMQVCSVRIYLRRGQLLDLKEDFLGGGITVDTRATPPVIGGYAHGGARWSMRWQNGGFR
ncbi:hypothetical protein [Tropicibacter sp. S64]|uniref:hypothetical protein n=1 Tax=Tropicibacter sp. S64 TaxID=3415122 RepID=UPI003C7A8C9C